MQLSNQSNPSRLKETKNTPSPTNKEIPKLVIISIARMTAAIASKVSSSKIPLMYVY